MKRSLLLIAGFVTITFFSVWYLLPTDPINAAKFERIESRMTEQQVEEILGKSDRESDIFIGSPPFDHKTKTWSRPGRDFIIVSFKFEGGEWFVERKRGIFLTFWERARYWWDGVEPNGEGHEI